MYQDIYTKREGTDEDHYENAGKEKVENGFALPHRIDKFLGPLRKNNDDYVAFIYRFAQVVVPAHKWWDRKEVTTALNGEEYVFGQFFSCSDEAFIIVVLENYIARWHDMRWQGISKANKEARRVWGEKREKREQV